ncbi:unnamed protein product [Urochloa decumbens]|uniref:C2H2-type domain-containing protein n=1 Tax=Urochloa decumbens TaxID=240449 RepID=A0ABC9E186_9POAL
MEFRFRAGGPRPRSPSPAGFSSGPCDRRFSPRPRAGPFHGQQPPPPPQPFEWEAAAWRERIIGQEVERRLIEEACLIEAEVHRQLAVARARFQGVFGPLPFVGPGCPLLPLPPPAAFFGPHGPFMPPVPPPLMPVGMQPIPNGPPPASLGDSEVFDGRVGFEQSILVKRRRPLQPPKPKPKHKVEQCEVEPSKSFEILSPETKVSGVKRKADVISASTEPTELQNVISATTEPPELQNAARQWSCDLCQVTTTTRADLDKHLRGRRHWNKLPLMPVGMHPIPNGPLSASFGESEGFDGCVGFEQSILVKRGRPLLLPKQKPKPKHKVELREIEPSKISEILSPETKVSGVKRKADVISTSTEPTELQNVISATTEPPELQNAARHRCCELCQVTATTRADLNKHLRGRRHLNKLVQCGDIQVIGDDKSDKGTGPTDALRTIHILVNGSIHEVVQKSDLTLASTEPIEPQKAISGTTETAELQNETSATTESTELQNAARHWCLAVCQVRNTSKGKQRKHLSWKKHLKRKMALYGKKIHILVDGAMHEVVQQGDFVWCEHCSVRCINATTMADHLRGKKHSSLNKIWRPIKAVRMKNKRKSQLLHARER